MIRHCIPWSWPGLSGPSTTFFVTGKTWMPGTRLVLGPAEGRTRVPGMTNGKALVCCEVHL
jgi:hypothetical protein